MSRRDVAELLEANAVPRVEMAPIIPVDSLTRRRNLRGRLSVGEAERIAGVLGKPSKMPGYSYGLSALLCQTGSQMAKVPGSVCSTCYALTDWYLTWRPLHKGQGRRLAGLQHPQWEDALVVLIERYTTREVPFFRWHDSGDLQGVWHLERIVRVCERTPWVTHWLPTREYKMVADFLAAGGVIPPNLTIRLSALMIDSEPPRELPGVPLRPGERVIPPELYHLPTSTVHTAGATLPVQGKGSIQCAADKHTKYRCESCRACWEPRVRNVSYAQH